MLDFGITFNIIFTAVSGALILFLLASFIAVAAKGKRKCNAFDVILRIVSALAFAASAVLVAACVLVRLGGGLKITVAAGSAALDAGGKSTALPFPVLFAALTTVMGASLSAALFAFSLVALIVDCTLANKKKKRELKVTNSVKTPEQRRIAAEVAKIRAIGNSAVRRTSAAAENAENAEVREMPEAPAAASHTAPHAAPPHEAAPADKPAADESPADWRTAPEQKHSGFVGLEHSTDPDFDTFDSFDSFVSADDGGSDTPVPDTAENADLVTDEYIGDLDGALKTESNDSGSSESTDDTESGEPTVPDVYENTDVPSPADDGHADTDYADNTVADGGSETYADFKQDAESDDTADETVSRDSAADGAERARQEAKGYAPDRNIYFPKIRTISRYTPERPQKAEAGAKKSDKPSGGKKPAAQKPASGTAKKPSGGKKPAQQTERGGKNDIPPDRKLPVNRRYVIIDRRSAVNMFGDYLRERDGEQKDKLKSSISTIILK